MRFKLYDVLRLSRPVPEKNLPLGSGGAIVQVYDQGSAYVVEFCDEEGYEAELYHLKVIRSFPKFFNPAAHP